MSFSKSDFIDILVEELSEIAEQNIDQLERVLKDLLDQLRELDLSIDYRGAIEGELNKDEANIFYQLKKEVTRIKQKADDKKTKMREKQKEEEKKIKENKSADKDEQDEQKQALAKTAAQSQTALDNKTKDQVFRDKLYWYSYFLT